MNYLQPITPNPNPRKKKAGRNPTLQGGAGRGFTAGGVPNAPARGITQQYLGGNPTGSRPRPAGFDQGNAWWKLLGLDPRGGGLQGQKPGTPNYLGPADRFTPDTELLKKFAPGADRQAARQQQRQDWRQGLLGAGGGLGGPANQPPGTIGGGGAQSGAGGSGNHHPGEPAGGGGGGGQGGAGGSGQGQGGGLSYHDIIKQLGLPLDPFFLAQRTQAQNARDAALNALTNQMNVGTAQLDQNSLLGNRQIDENMAARGLFGSGVERRDERLLGNDIATQRLGLQNAFSQGQLGARQDFRSQMMAALMELAQRQQGQKHLPLPNWGPWANLGGKL